MTDDELIRLYEWWSEDRYCASFMSPHPSIVQQFANWLSSDEANEVRFPTRGELEDYELEFLTVYRALAPSTESRP